MGRKSFPRKGHMVDKVEIGKQIAFKGGVRPSDPDMARGYDYHKAFEASMKPADFKAPDIPIGDPSPPGQPAAFDDLLIAVEMLAIALGVGYPLWTQAHPVAGIVGGGFAMWLYKRLHGIKVLGFLISLAASLGWACLAGYGTSKLTSDPIWIGAAAVLLFILAWIGHKKMMDED